LAWTVEIGDFAEKQLRKLDATIRDRILAYLFERIEGCKNPRHFGEPLKDSKAGWWRYRVGDYRITCQIQDEKVIVLVLAVGRRREIYR
jgi:mRNA interferase RelE/StbE